MITKTQNAQVAGTYAATAIDAKKEGVEFRLINVSPNVIRWKDGTQETVASRRLAKLQACNSWMADF